jgi:hypothetical protein
MQEILLAIVRQSRGDLGQDRSRRLGQDRIAHAPHLGYAEGDRLDYGPVEGLRGKGVVPDQPVAVPASARLSTDVQSNW